MNELTILKFYPMEFRGDVYETLANVDMLDGDYRLIGVQLCRALHDGRYFTRIPGRPKGKTRGINIAGESPLRDRILETLVARYEDSRDG